MPSVSDGSVACGSTPRSVKLTPRRLELAPPAVRTTTVSSCWSRFVLLPSITVRVGYPGVGPLEIEELITRPLEQAVIRETLEERTGRAVSSGAIYTALARLDARLSIRSSAWQ